MGKLSDLYKARETFKGLGLELSEEQEAQLRSLEEDIIKRDILPLLTEKIEPALQQVQRELVLVVDYIPGHRSRLASRVSATSSTPSRMSLRLSPTRWPNTALSDLSEQSRRTLPTRLFSV